jgi:phosphoglycolate phosphatase-like HAD superfamily hydrolase
MSLSSGRAQLASAFKTIEQHWDEVCQHWRDVVRDEFGRDYWLPLANRVPEVLTAMDNMDLVLAQMRRDCGDEGEGIA